MKFRENKPSRENKSYTTLKKGKKGGDAAPCGSALRTLAVKDNLFVKLKNIL